MTYFTWTRRPRGIDDGYPIQLPQPREYKLNAVGLSVVIVAKIRVTRICSEEHQKPITPRVNSNLQMVLVCR